MLAVALLLVVLGILLVLIVFRELTADASQQPPPTINQSESQPSVSYPLQTLPSNEDSAVQPLTQTNLAQTYSDLEQSNLVQRALKTRKAESVSGATQRVIRSGTEMMREQASQIKEVLTARNEIQKLQDDGELLPLEKQKRQAELLKQIAESERDESRARKESADLFKEPPPPPAKPEPKDPAQIADERVRAYVRKNLGPKQAADRVEREMAVELKDNPELMEDVRDILTRFREEEAQK